MNAIALSEQIGKSADGLISHTGLTFPGQSESPPSPRRGIYPSSTPPQWSFCTTEEFASKINTTTSNAWHILVRHNITGITYKNKNLWKLDEAEDLASSYLPILGSIPAGYITLSQAAKLSRKSTATFTQHLKKYGIIPSLVKVRTSTGAYLAHIISKDDLSGITPHTATQTESFLGSEN